MRTTGDDSLSSLTGENAWEVLLAAELFEGELISTIVELEARRRGLETARVNGTSFVARSGDRQAMFYRTIGPSVSRAATRILYDKWATKSVLRAWDLPTPDGARFHPSSIEEAGRWAEQHDWDVVLKPVSSSKGRGFIGEINDGQSFRRAWERLSRRRVAKPAGMLLEKRQPGLDTRLYVVGREIVGAIQRTPAQVTGNGRATVGDLIAGANKERASNPNFRSRLINEDQDLYAELDRQSLGFDSVPEAGRAIHLRRNANVSSGGGFVDVSTHIHQDWLDLAQRVSDAFSPMQQFAIDVLLQSVSESPWTQDFGILELEGDPAVSSIHFPLAGPGRNVCGRIVELYFGSPSSMRFDDGIPDPGLIDYRLMSGVGLEHLREIVGDIRSQRLEPSDAGECEDVGEGVPGGILPGVVANDRRVGAAATTEMEAKHQPAKKPVSKGTADAPPSSKTTTQAYRFVVSGSVVGVGFRWWAVRKARSLGLSGWIRNAGGQVEGVVAGRKKRCESFLGSLLEGPRRATVTDVCVQRATEPSTNRFEVRRSVRDAARGS